MASYCSTIAGPVNRWPGRSLARSYTATSIGDGPPRFTVDIRTAAGRRAIASFDELAICEAYIAGDLDFDGDMVAALGARQALTDRRPWIKTWRWLQPLIFGRERCNRAWIAKHYDSANLQLLAVDDAGDERVLGEYTFHHTRTIPGPPGWTLP